MKVRIRIAFAAAIVAFGVALVPTAAPAAVPAHATPGSAQEGAYPWRMEEVAPGVYAALQPTATRFDDSNSTVIIGTNEVVVVDAQSEPAAVRSLITWIGTVTEAPVQLVINTHWHGDHTQGNAIYRDAYGDGLEIIGHASLTEDVPQRAAAFVSERTAYFDAELPAARERLAQGVFRDGTAMTDADKIEQTAVLDRADEWLAANRDARFVAPSRTYTSRQRLQRAGHTIDLIHFQGHTRGDTVVWLPREGVALTGDLLDDLPYAGHGYPTSWRAALATLRDLPIRATVPGHGPVFRDSNKLEAVHDFLDALIRETASAVAEDRNAETVMDAMNAGPWRARLASDDVAAGFFDQTLPEAIERAWLEAKGEIE
jgi:glyoxylase-like metal-dependent hydrolase (beta-lactamase superfamily II)